MHSHCDVLIRGGLVFDGFGEGKSLDVAVKNGLVAALGPSLSLSADREIDATGLWITPGFIDIHTHYDLEVELAPLLSESVRHGVTTVVMGGCSLSTIYGDPQDLADIFSRVETLPKPLIDRWLKVSCRWSSPKSYFQHLKELRPGPNLACMLGHSALRVKVMGLERSLSSHATANELNQMRALAEEALEAGCIGISVDMVHWHKVAGKFTGLALPSHHAAFEEYEMLADVCRQRDAVFQVTPNPIDIRSFLNIIKLSPGIWRAPLRNTILSALDMDRSPDLWRIFSPLLFVLNQILGCNIRFQTLAEPFTIYSDGHVTPFFEEFSAGVKLNNCSSVEERRSLWRDPNFREEFSQSWNSSLPRMFHRDFKQMKIVSAPDSSLNGKTIAQAAGEAETAPLDYFMKLLEEHDEKLRWVACSANKRGPIRRRLMKHPHIFPGFSDAGAHSRNLAFFDNSLSVIREAVSTGFIPVEKAISRVTGEPSRWFNLETGHLRTGARADLVLLDPIKLVKPIPEAVPLGDAIFEGMVRMVKRDPDPAVRHVFIKGVEVARDGAPIPVPDSEELGMLLSQKNPARSSSESLSRYRNRVVDWGGYAVDLAGSGAGDFFAEQDYWPIFLLKHQHPANVAFHMVGFILMYAIPVFAFSTSEWLLLLFLPLSQALGLIGHWLFERSPIDQRDTVFSWRAFASLHLMFLFVISFRYWSELARIKNKIGSPHQAF